MPSYEPIKQKVEGDLDENEILLSQASKQTSLADEHSATSSRKKSRWRLRTFNLTEIGLVVLLIVSNLLWFVSSKPWGQPMLKDPNYCE
ncbi:hypothetical protein RRF57_011832 [Xylaria bambusicola]|uniref:Uncharacterized protein n=1 Tax=Xylaria bambusicola TaxID=326684 RepID=A0AAN7UNH9_9PEZI